MQQYPIVLIPPAIAQSRPHLPSPFTLKEPSPPHRPSLPPPRPDPKPTFVNWKGMPIVSRLQSGFSVGAGLGFAIVTSQLIWAITGFLVAAGIIASYAWQDSRQYPKRKRAWESREQNRQLRWQLFPRQKQEYENQASQYKADAALYTEARAKHLAQLEQIKAPLLQVLATTLPAQVAEEKAKTGHNEHRFKEYLCRTFPGKIAIGLELREPNFTGLRAYQPDFVYSDPATKLRIDIELDEPYAYNSKQPIHYAGHEGDRRRDQFFLFHNWVVIRFCEEQAIRYPESCCRFIAEQIAHILGEDLPSHWHNVPALPFMPQWTKMEAEKMAKNNHRDKY